MRTSLLSRGLRAVCRLFWALITALLLCLILLLAADVLRCVGALFTDMGGDKVLTLGKWKFIFREEILEIGREKWGLLCRAVKAVLPVPFPETAAGLAGLIIRAFSLQ